MPFANKFALSVGRKHRWQGRKLAHRNEYGRFALVGTIEKVKVTYAGVPA